MSQLTAAEKRALAEYYDATRKAAAQQPGADPRENAKERGERIDRLKGDFTAFCKYYLPHYMTDRQTGRVVDFGWFHLEAVDKIVADPDIFAALEWPRGHAKSVFADVMLVLYLKALGQLDGVIIAGQNEKKATALLIDVQVQLETNARYIADYGEQMKHGDWSSGEFSTVDGTGFWAYGRGQSPRGTRKGEKRPNLIICDDIDDKEICKNQERVAEAVAWVREDLMGCFDGTQGRFILAGNRIHRQSILAHLIGDVEEGDVVNPEIVHIKVFALEDPVTHLKDDSPGGVPAWGARFTRAQLEKRFAKIGKRSTLREYFHEHTEEGRVFQRDWFRYVPIPDLSVYEAIVVYTDPSYRDGKKSDFKATVAVGRLGRYYDVLACWLRQDTKHAMVAAQYELDQWLRERGAKRVQHWIEGKFIQTDFLEDYDQYGEAVAGWQLPIRADDRDKPDKVGRIEDTSVLFERGMARVSDHLRRDRDGMALVDQFVSFPTGHDDGPDAFEGAVFKLKQMVRLATPIQTGGQRRNNAY